MVESSPLPIRSLRADQARKLALRAQGFSGTRPSAEVDAGHGRKVFKQLGAIQIDSVNVLCRSQELPLFARLGSHRRDLIHNLTEAQDIFEYWGHEASHLPVGMHPLLRWRMAEAVEGKGIWGDVAAVARQDPTLIANVLAQIVERGPLSVSEIEGGGERGEHMWAWSPGKRALEYLFWSGRITARRGPNFERRYDLAERMLPAKVLDEKTPNPLEAKKDLLEIAVRAHGVGTAKDLADYYRLNVVESRTLLGELVNEGRLVRCEVEGWSQPAYQDPRAKLAREHSGRALLSPFDSLIWERDRTERIFGFRYRLEIYVPKAKRVHGYYVLAFLLDGQLVARVDLKAHRQAGVLRVQHIHGEDKTMANVATQRRVGEELAAELTQMAAFLNLDAVEVAGIGNLAGVLSECLPSE